MGIVVTLGDGAGGFLFDKSYDTPSTTMRIRIADIDGDQRNELLGLDSLKSRVRIVSQGSGASVPAPRYLSVASSPSDFTIGDLDGDLRPDIVAVSILAPGNLSVITHR